MAASEQQEEFIYRYQTGRNAEGDFLAPTSPPATADGLLAYCACLGVTRQDLPTDSNEQPFFT